MQISFNGFWERLQKDKHQYATRFTQVLKKGICFSGPENAILLNNLQKYFKKQYILLVGSGHDALYLTLKSLNLKHEDEVLVQTNAYPTAFAVVEAGASLRLVDVDKNAQMDAQDLERRIIKKTKVVIMVHLCGLVGEVKKVQQICRERNLFFIEDCAQSLGSRYKNKLLGTFGNFGCFSFYPTKNLGTFGDGGFIICNCLKHLRHLQMLCNYGEKKRYQSEIISRHSRLPELQAAFLNMRFLSLENNLKQRVEKGNYYLKQLIKLEQELKGAVRPLISIPASVPAQHLVVIIAKRRDQLKKYLTGLGIETLVHYPFPIHLVKAFKYLKYQKNDFPIAEHLAKHKLSLPFYPELPNSKIDYIISAIRRFYAQKS